MGNIAETQEEFMLLDAFLNNKEVTIRDFYVAEYPKTKRYILKNGGTLENAKDIFQEAYFNCWKKLTSRKFNPKNRAEIEAYLFTIAKNKWVDILRKKAKTKTISIDAKLYHLASDESASPNELNNREEQLTITINAFENLGEDCKNLLTQFYFDKMSLRAIAQGLEIEEASAKNKKYRCIQKLKELASNNT